MRDLCARLLTLTTFALSVVASPVPEPGPNHPDWDKVYIKQLPGPPGFGSGCPWGTVNPTIAPDGSYLNLAFSDYYAQVYPGSKPNEAHKACQLRFELHFPAGWTVTLFDTTFMGWVKLDKKITASQMATYHFGGHPQNTATFTCPPKTGPLNQAYSCTDKLLIGAYVWSSCKGTFETLFIDTQIDVDNSMNKAGSGYINTQSTEAVVQKYGFLWKPC